ncbi:MAG TPA: AraC family transcriptional regulator [Chitinophagaceae bacterium]|nr:AraC family transcriptional regulator [Chitinophagaceae bacterium]
MFSLNYKLSSYRSFLHEMAAVFGTTVMNDRLELPPAAGNGYFKSVQFDGVDAVIYDFVLSEELLVRRMKEDAEYYTLVFDELPEPAKFAIHIGKESLSEGPPRNSAIYLTSFLHDVEYSITSNIHIKGLRIRLSKIWMQKFLQLSSIEEVLEQYISLKTKNIWRKPVDVESKELLYQLLENKEYNLLYYQNKIHRIIEIFFIWLVDESRNSPITENISRTDIEAVERIEGMLTSEKLVLPPSMKELARSVAMSESKLKRIFKIVYGAPVFEYFQKHRMQKARQMLLSGAFSVKDVGYTLGYSNLSNFSVAFKKEFGKLPSEVLKQSK